MNVNGLGNVDRENPVDVVRAGKDDKGIDAFNQRREILLQTNDIDNSMKIPNDMADHELFEKQYSALEEFLGYLHRNHTKEDMKDMMTDEEWPPPEELEQMLLKNSLPSLDKFYKDHFHKFAVSDEGSLGTTSMPNLCLLLNTSGILDNSSSCDHMTSSGGLNDEENMYLDQWMLVKFLNQFYIPVLIAFGIIGNTLACIVFLTTRLRMRSSSMYLAALALAEMSYLLIILLLWLDFLGFRTFDYNVSCQLEIYLGSVSSSTSVYLTMAFTMERFIAVEYPLQRPLVCTVRKARAAIAIIVVFAATTNAYIFITAGIEEFQAEDGSSVSECVLKEEYLTVMNVINWMDTVLTLILPVVLIGIMNTLIAKQLYRFSRHNKRTGSILVTNNGQIVGQAVDSHQMHSTTRDIGHWLALKNHNLEGQVPGSKQKKILSPASIKYGNNAKRWKSKELHTNISRVERVEVNEEIHRHGSVTTKCYCKTKINYVNEIINTSSNSLPYDTQYSTFANQTATERADSRQNLGKRNYVPIHGSELHTSLSEMIPSVSKPCNFHHTARLSDYFHSGKHPRHFKASMPSSHQDYEPHAESRRSQGHDQECYQRVYIHELPSAEPSGDRNSQKRDIYEGNFQGSLQGKLRTLQYSSLYGNKLATCYNNSSASTPYGRYNLQHPEHKNAAAALAQTTPRNILTTKAQYSITMTLLLTSTVFLLLNLPSYVIRVYGFFMVTWDFESSNHSEWVVHNLQQLSIVLQHTHYGINFIFYSTCGSTFRECLFSLLPVRLQRAVCFRKRYNANMYQ